jgi:hypothetical protein
LHRELIDWVGGRSGEEFVTTSMANYLASTGRMPHGDAARVASGRLSEDDRNRLFTLASYGHDLGDARTSYRKSNAQRGAAARAWAQGFTEANRSVTEPGVSDSGLVDSDLTAPGLTGPGLTGSGVAR